MQRKTIKKIALVGLAASLVALFVAFDLDRYLSLGYLKESQEILQGFYADKPFTALSAFILTYIVVTALSLPGAVVLTLAAGAVFGIVAGTIAVSIGSTTGATLACMVSRFVLQDWVQNRFGDKLKAVNSGVEREGALYLFSVRLIPIFPFFVINLVMGLTRMPLRTFFWVSQLGMLPGTIVFVNAGKQLGKIESVSGILSPALIASFVILGLFPLIARKIMQLMRKKALPGKGGNMEDGEGVSR